MIDDLLNRPFVLAQAERIREYLAAEPEGGRRRGAPAPELTDVEPEDRDAAAELLSASLSEEQARSSGQPGFDAPGPTRRGEAAAPDIDEVSFFSRDAALSNVQSALDQYYDEREPDKVEEARPAEGRRRGGGSAEPVARTGRSLTKPPAGRRLLEQFGPTDIGWVSSVFAQGIRLFRKRHRFKTAPATPRPLGDRARLIVLGDWGTGIPRAVNVSARIRDALRQGEAEGREQHVVHLGDVYYSGWSREYSKRFLPHWPVAESEADEIGSWSLNANHDMYSGGHGYYRTLLADPRFHAQERSSFFSLVHPRWRILGLDTGWEDASLKDPQADWVAAQSRQAAQSGQKLLLLSHHQLFSAYEDGSEKVQRKLRAILDAGGVHSWLWGHEHRCILYKPHGGLQFAACLGHGGVPVYMKRRPTDPLPAPADYEYRARRDEWALFGFAILDFEDDRIHVRLIDENGDDHKQATIA
jgi:hypothetical protein